ncbi:hypothetical protein GCM10010964_11860 [Caldovatus sediminis]|uniref:Uncharacterized protein n=1 Tax=Caldovatus sediminis TaxID=2041189 RepID=A0A8J2Z9E0_9PROT|nr:hypothetical protein [Caldovatus sediminis]GGG25502.1 hypothetical protein GCM10010964_11860 [Caldovatus sediminis]
MAEIRTILFADGMLDATVANGVARITLAQSGPEGKPMPAGQLCVPLVQLPTLANGLVNLLRQVEARAKEAQQQRQAAAPESDSIAVPPPGAFRFQS